MTLTTFEVFDIILLVIFTIIVSWFLWKNRNRLGKEGIIFLYRTEWGMKLIDNIGKKYKKLLDVLRYVIIITGYILMGGIVYLIIKTIKEYFWNQAFIGVIGNSPPIALVIPYFPRIFGYESFFPPFYFIYFILAIAIVAAVHEFAHGVYMRRYNIKIKSTGIAFLGPILGAFVEQDEKDMKKAKKIDQMTILGAGVFANIVVGILFFIILALFFSLLFTPLGIVINDYPYKVISISDITSIGNVPVDNPNLEQVVEIIGNNSLINIKVGDESYSGIKGFSEDGQSIGLYYDAPAINTRLSGVITSVNGVKIDSIETLSQELLKYSPGEKVVLGIFDYNDVHNQDIILGENPENKDKAFIGVATISQNKYVKHYNHFFLAIHKSNLYILDNVYYSPKIQGVSEFIYYLFWWIVLLNLLVGFFNMLPAGIFDGGRFFYLTIVGITKSEKIAKRTFSVMTYLLLLVLFSIIAVWIFRLLM